MPGGGATSTCPTIRGSSASSQRFDQGGEALDARRHPGVVLGRVHPSPTATSKQVADGCGEFVAGTDAADDPARRDPFDEPHLVAVDMLTEAGVARDHERPQA